MGGPHGCPLNIARDRAALLLDPGRDSGGNGIDLGDRAGNALDGRDRFAGRRLNGADLRCDLLGCLGGLRRERFDFRSDDRESLSGFARPRRLDRRIERQEIGLAGSGVDQAPE